MEGSDVVFRVGFDSRIFLERAEMFGTTAFTSPVIAMTTNAKDVVLGHAHCSIF